MISYFIHLRNSEGQKGYFLVENPSGFTICDDIAGACPFESEEAASHALASDVSGMTVPHSGQRSLLARKSYPHFAQRPTAT